MAASGHGHARLATFVVLATCAVALLAPATSSAGPGDPSISPNEAWLYSFDALKKKFDGSLVHSQESGMHCSKRLARNLIRCKPSWFIGDVSYHGRLYVSHQRRKATNRVKAVVEGKIKQFNSFCAVEHPGPSCTTHYKVHRTFGPKYCVACFHFRSAERGRGRMSAHHSPS